MYWLYFISDQWLYYMKLTTLFYNVCLKKHTILLTTYKFIIMHLVKFLYIYYLSMVKSPKKLYSVYYYLFSTSKIIVSFMVKSLVYKNCNI